MNTFELFQIFSMSGQKLDALWQFYVTVHLAIFGALFIFHKMKTHQIVISIISYLVFSVINLRAKIYEYIIYSSFLQELRNKDLTSLPHINDFLSDYTVDDRITITITIHALSLSLLLFLLIKSKDPNK